jgi:hypothetical protein
MKQNTSPRTKKLRSVPSAGKVMLMLFWDFNRSILEHFQDQGQTIGNAWYCVMLEELKPVICSEHGGTLTNWLFGTMTMLDLIYQQ